jgi:hypothetical protein
MLEYIIITVAVLAYAGLHAHLHYAAKPLKSLSAFDTERNEFLVERMLQASKNAGTLSRLCSTCQRVVHKYDLFANGTVRCHDCKAGV